MKIYLDVLLLINYLCDFLILLSVLIILKRTVSIKRILFASLFGSFTIIILFINMNNILLFLLKILLGVVMVLIAFKYKNIKYFLTNLLYFFMSSILLGGFIYFINLKLKNVILNELLFNTVVFLISSPIIILVYIKTSLNLKNNYSLIYKVDIYINKKIINLNGYYDTGNNLIDPYKKRPIIVVNSKHFKELKLKYLLVPFNTIETGAMMKCFKPDKVRIKSIGYVENVLIGITENEFKINGIDCLINKKIMEGAYESKRFI